MGVKVTTPEAVLSYPALFEPKAMKGSTQEPKYSAVFVFPAGTDLSALKAAAIEAGEDFFGGKEKFAALLKKSGTNWPFRTDGAEKGYPEGSIFISARSNSKPGVVSRYAGVDGKPTAITDPKEMYAGARVRATLTAFGFDNSGKKGVTFGLNNIQKLGEGDRLDGRTKAEDDFEAMESDPVDVSVQ